MSKALPELIHPFRLARGGETLRGSIPTGRMPRLGELLCRPCDEARFELHFGFDDQGQARVLGRIEAGLVMRCQRCLEPMEVEVACPVSLALVHEDGEIAGLDADYEPLKVTDEGISLTALIEDELLLGLPSFALHPPGACEMPAGADAADASGAESGGSGRENPFSILKSLKSRESS